MVVTDLIWDSAQTVCPCHGMKHVTLVMCWLNLIWERSWCFIRTCQHSARRCSVETAPKKKQKKNRQSTYHWNFLRSLFLGENKRVPPLVPTMFYMCNSGKTADDLNHQLHRCGWLGILGFKRNKTVAAKQCHWSKWTKTKNKIEPSRVFLVRCALTCCVTSRMEHPFADTHQALMCCCLLR